VRCSTLTRVLAGALGLAWLLDAGLVRAYSDPAQFAAPTLEAGGGGRFYTGSPAEGYGCDTCHTGGEQPKVRVFGVPARYVPRATYEIFVSWSSTIEHASMALELTDARGHGAGSLGLPPVGSYVDAEQCRPVDGEVLAAQLYAADRERTIAAAPDCGASGVRVQWTAPDRSVGAVWLTFGALASNHDQNYGGDGVTQFSQQIPVYGETVSSTLESGCSVTPGLHARSAPAAAAALWALLVLRRLSRRRRRATLARHTAHLAARSIMRFAAGFSLLCGCGVDPAGLDPRPVQLRLGGAVEPWDGAQRLMTMDAGIADAAARALDGASLEAGPPDAMLDAAPVDDADGGSHGDAGMAPATPTQLAFRVTTLPQGGEYEPDNIGAIWIEDGAGHWVKTLALWASVRVRYLQAYNTANSTHNKVDAVTGATLTKHKTHNVTWRLDDANGQRVADGDYSVRVEVTDQDSAGQTTSVPFTLGQKLITLMPADVPYFAGIELRLESGAATP
jgi:hypothetical protein